MKMLQVEFFSNLETNQLFLVFFMFFLSAIYLWRKTHNGFPPGPFPWPIIGNPILFQGKHHIRLTNLKNKYGDIFSLKAGKNRIVFVCSLDGVINGLNQSDDTFDDRPNLPSFHWLFHGCRQKGLGTADFDEKTSIKKKFIIDCLGSYCSVDTNIEEKITTEAVNLLCYFLKQEEEFDPKESFQFAHLHIMMTLVFHQTQDQAIQDVYKSLKTRSDAKKVFSPNNFFPFLHSFYKDDFQSTVERTELQMAFQRDMLNHHKDTYSPHRLRDIVDHLLLFIESDEDHGLIDCDDIEYLLMEIFESGFSAVPAILQWLIGYMVAFPDCQKLVQRELDEVVGRERFPSLVNQPYLPFTMAVILEVQRIVTVFPFLQPHRTTKHCVFQGFDIPEDTIMMFNIWSIHHDKRYWKNPMRFDPHRFLDDKQNLVIPDQYMPFGAGKRSCPGETLVDVEIFLFFTYIMHQVTVTAAENGQVFKLESEFDEIVHPKPFKVFVQSRVVD
ncbi:cytochrome P450 2C31-like [Mytilus trossulus]|uniref:cytochrome P450 2C31-like n=1 Tax=Mytilus trossulus TaxID=6551 RepID=UPI0030079DF3